MAAAEIACNQTDERLSISGPGWTVRFDRAADRWTHSFWFGSSDHEPAEVVGTVESLPERDDPARIVSPVYQELHRHEPASDQTDGVCLLLTGHFFQHHFSAAISVFRDPDDPRYVVVDCDVADRCRSPVESLAATYLVRLGFSDLAGGDPHRIAWDRSLIVPGRLAVACKTPGTLALAEAGRQAMRVQVLAAIDPATFTHRVRYHWRWESSSRLTL
jgi:hypothetical protein